MIRPYRNAIAAWSLLATAFEVAVVICAWRRRSVPGSIPFALTGLQQGMPPFSPGLPTRLPAEFARLSGASSAPEKESAVEPAPEDLASSLAERQTEVLRLVAGDLTYAAKPGVLAVAHTAVRLLTVTNDSA